MLDRTQTTKKSYLGGYRNKARGDFYASNKHRVLSHTVNLASCGLTDSFLQVLSTIMRSHRQRLQESQLHR